MKKTLTMSESTTTTKETVGETTSVQQITEKDVYKIPAVQQLVLLGVILLLIFSTTITPKIFALVQKNDDVPALLPESNQKEDGGDASKINETKPFETISITAKAAYVFDVTNEKVLFAKNDDEVLPLASITKLMTALVAEEILEKTHTVAIDTTAVKQDGDSGLQDGEIFKRQRLSDYVLMSSSNDGAFALASAAGNVLVPTHGASAFVHAMNIRAQELGLIQTHFKNPTGLDINPYESGANGTAKDIAILMTYIVENEPDILSYTQEEEARIWSESGQYHDAKNTNYYIAQIPGLLGSKTGYTELAGGNLVVAFSVGLERPIITVVLGSTHQERFTDTLKLVSETERYIARELVQ